MVELIEAAVRAGAPSWPRRLDRHLTRSDAGRAGPTGPSGSPRARRRFSSEDERAETLYVEAIERLARTRIAVDLARAHLLYGEWLRRQRRRMDARKELRTAHELFSDFGMEAFAERARVELRGDRRACPQTHRRHARQLTPQEAQISRLVAQGNTNREIAAQLFISPSTVEYHLRKAFRKLGVRSRTQLARRIA